MRSLRLVPMLAFALFLGGAGCINQALTKAITQAPNTRDIPAVLRPQAAGRLRRDDATFTASWMVPVGPPAAELAVAMVEPGDYKLSHSLGQTQLPNGRIHVWPKDDWVLPPVPLANPSPKGTVLVLHGYEDSKEDMMHWAIYLAQSGYRVVLADLRGHGRSTGKWIGYGAFEVRDLGQVIDFLQKKGLVAGRIGVLGISYGASMSLELAGGDSRVSSVVAIEPFSNPRTAVAEFARALVPGLVKGWSDADFMKAEDRAGRLARFSWQDADVLGSVARTSAPILYVYSEKDHWISPDNTRLLASRTRSLHAVLTVGFTNDMGIENHVLVSWTLDPIAPPVVKWLDATLTGDVAGVKGRLEALGPIQ